MDKLWEELSQVQYTSVTEDALFLQPETETIKPVVEDFIIDNAGGTVTARKRGRPKKQSSANVNANPEQYRLNQAATKQIVESLTEAEVTPVVYGKTITIEELLNTNIIKQEGPNTFSCPYVYDIQLSPHELGPDIFNVIKNKISMSFLNQEVQGKMLVEFILEPDTIFYMGEIVQDTVTVKVPVQAKFKIYRIGDVISGKIKINNQKILIESTDILCEVYKENGIITIKNNKNCFVKDNIDYFENSPITVKLVSIVTTTKSFTFIANGVIHKNPETSIEVSKYNKPHEAPEI